MNMGRKCVASAPGNARINNHRRGHGNFQGLPSVGLRDRGANRNNCHRPDGSLRDASGAGVQESVKRKRRCQQAGPRDGWHVFEAAHSQVVETRLDLSAQMIKASGSPALRQGTNSANTTAKFARRPAQEIRIRLFGASKCYMYQHINITPSRQCQ